MIPFHVVMWRHFICIQLACWSLRGQWVTVYVAMGDRFTTAVQFDLLLSGASSVLVLEVFYSGH